MIKQLGFNNRKNHSKYNGRNNNMEIKKIDLAYTYTYT